MPQSSLCPSNRKFKQREEFTRDQASSRAGQDAKSSNVLSSKKKSVTLSDLILFACMQSHHHSPQIKPHCYVPRHLVIHLDL
jgi:hypothetical protein